MFELISARPADPLLKLIGQFQSDPRPGKIDLGVGVYRDQEGNTPVMKSVKRAEELIATTQASKAYLGLRGNEAYLELIERLICNDTSIAAERIASIQTPGGSGALRLGADLIRDSNPNATILVGQPCWSNHLPILQAASLNAKSYRHTKAGNQEIDFDSIACALADGSAGDIALLQTCGHNPTGLDFNESQWTELARICSTRGIIPFLDTAYLGLARGIEADRRGLSILLDAVPEALVAFSCSKSFGLYRERTGALLVICHPRKTGSVLSNLCALARTSYSMPPDHGAEIVRTILSSRTLKKLWRDEIHNMLGRIQHMRQLSHRSISLHGGGAMKNGYGMFSMLPLTEHQIDSIRDAYGIYIPASGRMNIAGLQETQIPDFAHALNDILVSRNGVSNATN